MKKPFIISMFLLATIASFSRDIPLVWINTGANRLDCRKINFGLKTARVVLTNGEKISIPVNSILSYSLNGREFVKLPLFKNNKATGDYKFMELLKTRDGLSLYRMEISQVTADLTRETVVTDPSGKLFLYFLYKNDKPYLKMDNKTLPNILSAYGFPYSAM